MSRSENPENLRQLREHMGGLIFRHYQDQLGSWYYLQASWKYRESALGSLRFGAVMFLTWSAAALIASVFISRRTPIDQFFDWVVFLIFSSFLLVFAFRGFLEAFKAYVSYEARKQVEIWDAMLKLENQPVPQGE